MTNDEIAQLYVDATEEFCNYPGNLGILDAFSVAAVSHHGQVDKSGEAYIKHVLRVAGSVPFQYMTVALLHDVFEDFFPVEGEEDILRAMSFLSADEVHALWLLTRQEGVTYEAYIRALTPNDIARAVKRADLMDHLRDTSKLSDSHIERYKQALRHIDSYTNV